MEIRINQQPLRWLGVAIWHLFVLVPRGRISDGAQSVLSGLLKYLQFRLHLPSPQIGITDHTGCRITNRFPSLLELTHYGTLIDGKSHFPASAAASKKISIGFDVDRTNNLVALIYVIQKILRQKLMPASRKKMEMRIQNWHLRFNHIFLYLCKPLRTISWISRQCCIPPIYWQ